MAAYNVSTAKSFAQFTESLKHADVSGVYFVDRNNVISYRYANSIPLDSVR